ncbi:MAG TPA: aminotransferase class III-fold pyridoxal phosphate-dependent enzyme [Candidatus Limnocylindria bacterium]|nr:aminotransferase class III-fold pyridoxal phosphate-dependent enzyme [Candidatus Limnocylindria bacterium]
MTTASVLAASPPDLTPAEAEAVARSLFGLQGSARPLVSERDQNFLLTDASGAERVLKVSNAVEDPAVVEMEVAAVAHIARVDPDLPVPVALPSLDGRPIAEAEVRGQRHMVRLIPRMPGRTAAPTDLDAEAIEDLGRIVARLGRALRGFFHPAAGRSIDWDQQRLPGLMPHAALVEDAARRALLDRVLARFTQRVVPQLPALRAQVIHDDVTLDNLLIDHGLRVSGIIDFGDMSHTALILDVPATLQSLVRGREDVFEVAEAFLAGYASITPLEAAEAELLGDLLLGRMAQTILISVVRTRQYPDNAYIHGWSEPAWELLEQLDRVGLDEASRRLAAMGKAPIRPSDGTDDQLVARRRRVLGSALEALSYRRPLHLVRGEGAWMEEPDGRRYLDAYNNVPVVGHAHPRVVDAIARQAAALNTNTRYLHERVVELGERLVATLPPELDTVMFVNSGSEANDLAWRLARAVTGADAGLVTDWAYHGVTAAIADLSPSEWQRGDAPSTAETFAAPNTYRGRYADAADPVSVAREEVAAAVARLAERGRRPAALLIDACFTSDGIFVPRPEVVAAIIGAARDSGAIYVADEVQSGHGRTGDGLWGHTAWGVTPDIVTLGKPMGNGHPVAAVITRAELADRLAAQTTFFSTFGGNPVACAAALAVLDIIDEEDLVAGAAAVGDALRADLASFAARHPAVGDVRGRGLMTGVELIDEPDGRQPAGDLASRVKDEMRERGVLIGTAGRHGNILKIRPPLCITRDEAALITQRLQDVLTDLGR